MNNTKEKVYGLKEICQSSNDWSALCEYRESGNERFVYELQYYCDPYDNSTLGIYFSLESMMERLLTELNAWKKEENHLEQNDVLFVPHFMRIDIDKSILYDVIDDVDYRAFVVTPRGREPVRWICVRMKGNN